MQRMLLVLVFSLIATAPALAARSPVFVEVSRDGDTFRIDAALFAPVPLDLAWEVLTDFERMEQFVPNVRDSRILSRQGDRLTILQRGVARFGPLAFPFESERIVESRGHRRSARARSRAICAAWSRSLALRPPTAARD